jgi:hypothetical protein
MPLTPQDIGTALYDLEGHPIGLNIARVDRVTNYALPSEVFVKQIDNWINLGNISLSDEMHWFVFS